jgi:hypothetical protein
VSSSPERPPGGPAGVRLALAALAGAAVAAIGGLILGEYEFVGFMPFIAGPLFGLAVAEAVTWAGSERGTVPGAVAGVLAALGLVWAGWIDSGEGIDPMPALVWPAAALGALTAAWRAGALAVPGRAGGVRGRAR